MFIRVHNSIAWDRYKQTNIYKQTLLAVQCISKYINLIVGVSVCRFPLIIAVLKSERHETQHIVHHFFFISSSLLVEELRKTMCALWQGTKGAISPESLFSVVWRVVPGFRYV